MFQTFLEMLRYKSWSKVPEFRFSVFFSFCFSHLCPRFHLSSITTLNIATSSNTMWLIYILTTYLNTFIYTHYSRSTYAKLKVFQWINVCIISMHLSMHLYTNLCIYLCIRARFEGGGVAELCGLRSIRTQREIQKNKDLQKLFLVPSYESAVK